MKQFKNYVFFWIVLVGLFNLCCFITPREWYGISKHSGSFWCGYFFVMGSFILHILYAYFVFSKECGKNKRVVHAPLLLFSFIELGVMIIVGTLCMVIPALPYWMAIMVCYIILFFSVVLMMAMKTVGENTVHANTTLNDKTLYMRELTNVAHELVSSAHTEPVKEITTKILESIRYSDMISSDETREYELAISEGLDELRVLIVSQDLNRLQSKAYEVIHLVEKRNNICKVSKSRI